MMREIVHIQVGNCGNKVSTRFWDMIMNEHELDPTGAYNGDFGLTFEGMNVCFTETVNGCYTPRAVLTDLDPGSIDEVKTEGTMAQSDRFSGLRPLYQGVVAPAITGQRGFIQKERR